MALIQRIPPVCANASICKTPGITGLPGKCPGKNHSLYVTFLTPTIEVSVNSMILSTNKNG